MAGKSVYLRYEEIMLIHHLIRESYSELRNSEIEKVRKKVELKMNEALYSIEAK